MTRYRVEVVEESVLRAVVDAPPEVDAMTQEQRREWLTEAALALADDASEPECFDCYYGNTDFWEAAPPVDTGGVELACEKCWRNANRTATRTGFIGGDAVEEIYRRLLTEPTEHPCTPDEQAGIHLSLS